jgi:excisionase family DNA binding protein
MYFRSLNIQTFATMTKKKHEDPLIDTNEAAERLGISRRHAWSLVRDGKLPAQKVGRTYVIKLSDLKLVETRPKVGRPSKKSSAKTPAISAETEDDDEEE